MRVDDFDYNLPEELIAQTPLTDRSASRLMVLDRETQSISHHHFYDIVSMIDENDCLILNNTKVLPSRIYGVKEDTLATIEVLLLKEVEKDVWEALTRPARRVKVGTIIKFSDDLKAECILEKEEGIRHFKMHYEGIFIEKLEQIGTMPLPPYIHEKLEDQNRYQTVYAKDYGSAAAPTAGLHFTEAILDELRSKGVTILYLTLHVGLGTFRPVTVDNIEDHEMHSEYYELNEETALALNEAKAKGKRLVAVGTTSARTLEANFKKYGKFEATKEETNIFIYPPYQFQAIDALFTNFHLPKSTLIMLVSALAGKEFILKAYELAVKERYRFFSFGDSMFIK